jgi:hypothetical protein
LEGLFTSLSLTTFNQKTQLIMKKTFTTALLILFTFYTGYQAAAQQLNARAATGKTGDRPDATSIRNIGLSPENQQSASRTGDPGNETQAIFDIQFNYPLSITSGVSCVYTGNEFWVGPWNKDSMFTLDPAGNITSSFKIAGIGTANSGVRAFTYDGTFIYAADNTTTIKKIDPVLKTLVGTITAPAAVRGLAYDSTANGGAGGFWISNFNTDFTQISMTGTTLDAITLGEHGVPSVYGIAFDPYTAGGPYIWAFGQGTSNPNDSAKLHRISVVTHLHTGVIHNVNADVAVAGAIAGSVSVTWRYTPDHFTLMGCTQDATNNLFGYELSDYTPPAVDAGCNSIDFYPPFLQIPTFEISQLSWDVNLTNNGTDPITDLATTFVLDDGTVAVYTPADFHTFGFTPGSASVASFGNFTPPAVPQVYNATANISTGAQTDQDQSNDVSTYSMAISDTVMARDNGTPTGSLGLPDGSAGVLGQIFELPAFCNVSSATFLLRNPIEGDSVSVDLYTYGTLPDVVVASTTWYVIAAADTDGVVITLPFIGGPLPTSAGIYFLGVNQTNSNITLGTSSFNWRPDAAYFQFAGGAWQTVESNTSPFIICYLLRLNLLDPSIAITEIDNSKFEVYPNPASSQLVVRSAQGTAPYQVELYDMIGNQVMVHVSAAAAQTILDVSGLAKGMYVVKTIVDGKAASAKISIQ